MPRLCSAASPLLALVLGLAAVPVQASPFDGRPKILLHVLPTTTKNACTWGQLNDCAGADTRGTLTTPLVLNLNYVYLIGARGNLANVGGVKCGIEYEQNRTIDYGNLQGVDVFSWVTCGDIHLNDTGGENTNQWPRAKSDLLVAWDADNCVNLDCRVAGYFYVGAYSADRMRITPSHRPDRGLTAIVADCSSHETVLEPTDLGIAAFSADGLLEGCNPCAAPCVNAIPVVSTTWSSIKRMSSFESQ